MEKAHPLCWEYHMVQKWCLILHCWMNGWRNLIPVMIRNQPSQVQNLSLKAKLGVGQTHPRPKLETRVVERIKPSSYHNRRWWHYGVNMMLLYIIGSLHYSVTEDLWLRYRVRGERQSDYYSSYAYIEHKYTEIGKVGTYPLPLYSNEN